MEQGKVGNDVQKTTPDGHAKRKTETPNSNSKLRKTDVLTDKSTAASVASSPSGSFTPNSISSPSPSPRPESLAGKPGDIDPKNLKERNVPAFLNKLYKMFHDSKYEGMTTWNKDGTSFFVLNPEEFSKTVLPKFFKHSNFSSFVRQLNMYGFHKIPHLEQTGNGTDDQGTWEFTNPNFRRGRPELLQLVKRKHPNDGKASNQVDINLILTELQSIKQHQATISTNLKNIEKDNQALWSEMKASRERYLNQQKLTHKILQFLASIYHPQTSRVSGSRFIMDSEEPKVEAPKISGEDIKKQLIELMSATNEEQPTPVVRTSDKTTTEIAHDLDLLDKNIESIQKTLRDYDDDISIFEDYNISPDQMATIVELNTGDDFAINEALDPNNEVDPQLFEPNI